MMGVVVPAQAGLWELRPDGLLAVVFAFAAGALAHQRAALVGAGLARGVRDGGDLERHGGCPARRAERQSQWRERQRLERDLVNVIHREHA